MTFLILSLAAITLATPQPTCAFPTGSLSGKRVFTNADLELMAACRYQTGAQSEVGGSRKPPAVPPRQAGKQEDAASRRATDEADWRARWRSVDQKARRLRREAGALRQEAGEAPRDPKKRPTGRRSPALLIGKAETLEAEARELERDFDETARREGALPGWLRPKGR